MEHRWRKNFLIMSAIHIEQGSTTSQWHLPGKWPLIHGIFLIKPPLLFKQKYVVLTDIHSSHLSPGLLLFSYKQINAVQSLPSLKFVAKLCFSLLQHDAHSSSGWKGEVDWELLFSCLPAGTFGISFFPCKAFSIVLCIPWPWALCAISSAFRIC